METSEHSVKWLKKPSNLRLLAKIIVSVLLLITVIGYPIYISPSRPLPFSYFLSEGWTRKTEKFKDHDILKILHANYVDGGPGLDTYIAKNGGTTLIDGVLSVRFEIYDFKNKSPNIIAIMAPGLADLENNTLTVKGDEGIDKLYLDGCLHWTSPGIQEGYYVLRATDIDGDLRTVMIADKIEIRIKKSCNNKYLDRYKDFIRKLKRAQP